MATAQTIINTAGQLLRITATPGAAVDATNSALLLLHLQPIIAFWSEKLTLELQTPATLGTTVAASEAAVDALALALYVRAGTLLGRKLDPLIVQEAKDMESYFNGRKSLKMEMSMADDGMPGLGRGRYNITSDS